MFKDVTEYPYCLGWIFLVCKMLGWIGLGQKFGPKYIFVLNVIYTCSDSQAKSKTLTLLLQTQ